MIRRFWWSFALLVLALSHPASGQWNTSSGARDTRPFRPRIFSEQPQFSYSSGCASMSDRISWYGSGASLSSTRYYDSLLRSPYGLDASRQLYQGTPPISTWDGR